jgi:hypothetical protein
MNASQVKNKLLEALALLASAAAIVSPTHAGVSQ